MNKRKRMGAATAFWLAELALLIAAACFAFALVGYTTIAMALISVAVIIALYRLISAYSKKNAKRGKRLKTVLTSLVCLGLVCFIIVEIPIVKSARTDKNPEAPYVIVLGAGVNGTVPSLSLLNRLTAAKEYLETYPEAVAIVSGGQGSGEDITEAECMRQWLLKEGIPAERIIMEDKSFSTEDNIRNSIEKIREHGGDPLGRIAIVSSEYHLYRAKYIAHGLGSEALGVAGHTSYPVLMVNYFIREALAVTYMWIM